MILRIFGLVKAPGIILLKKYSFFYFNYFVKECDFTPNKFSGETEADDDSTEYGTNKNLVPVNVTGSKQAGFISVQLSIDSDVRFLNKETVFNACDAHASHRRFLI